MNRNGGAARDGVRELVAALSVFPELRVTGARNHAEEWEVSCLMQDTPAGLESFSWVAFVVDCKCGGLVDMPIGGQHDEHDGQACFSLVGRGAPAADVAKLLTFAYETWRISESRN